MVPAIVLKSVSGSGRTSARTARRPRGAELRLRFEPLEERHLLSCTLPMTQTIRGVSVTFDQCYEREFNHAGSDYTIHTYYTEAGTTHSLSDNDDGNGDNINAVAMTDEAEAAFRFYEDRNLDFVPPGETTLEVYIANDPRIGGIPTWNSINVDAQYIDNNDQLAKRLLAYHEMHHLVQCQYGEYYASGSWNGFYGEGTARTIEDRFDTTLDADTGHLFIPEIEGILGNDGQRADDITSLSYRSVLWWVWLMDQYRQGPGIDPPVTGGSDLGWNALRDFYLEFLTQPYDTLGALDDFITAQGGSFRDDFIDYTLAMYAYKYHPADPRLGFLDAEINATAGLSGHNVITGSPAFTTDSPNMDPRSSRYWEFTQADQSDYISFTFDGHGKPFAFSVMTVDGGNLDQHWTSYADSFTRTVRSADLDRVVGVVTAFDQSGVVDVGYGAVDPTVRIKDPTSSAYKMVGLADNPRAFLVRLDVDGKDGSAVAGLVKEEFVVTLNKVGGGPDIPASIITSSYVQEDYWLLVQAPDDTDGAESGVFYDVTVDLGTSSSDTEHGAVVYLERVQDVQIVLDHSGSMGGGTGKIDAARNAANLLVNELSDDDQGGYIAFDTDADLRVPLDVVGSGSQRQDIEDAIAAEVPADWTSIGDGLRTALNDYAVHGNPANQPSFVLLSDGHENEPEYWADVRDDIEETGIVIHTISFGPGANEVLMQEIATTVSGGHHYAPDAGSVPINSVLGWQNNLSRVYDNVATEIAGRQRTLTALADSAVGGVGNGMIDFEDLPPEAEYEVGDTFVASGVPVTVQGFVQRSGVTYYGGRAEVDDQRQAGGLGQDMALRSVNLDFGFAKPLTGLVLQYGEYGGSVNLEINGELKRFTNLSDAHGTVLGDVEVSVLVVGDLLRFLVLSGQVESFAVGGEEFWIDNVRFFGEEGNLHEIPVDDASDVLVVSVAWQGPDGTHTTELFDPDGNPVPGAFRRVSSQRTNDVWEVPRPEPGVYTLRVNDLSQEYFVSASALSRYELYPFVDVPAEQATQGVEVPILASLIGKQSPVLGADVTAVVTDPTGVRRTLWLFDDGNHGDGLPADGVYGNVYTATSFADVTAVDPGEGEEPQAIGSYTVNWLAVKDDIRREAQRSFVIQRGVDSDQDGIPDAWEEAHGMDPHDRRDATLDPDKDGLPSFCEYRIGTDPFNSDTDGGGESDGSEVPYGPDQPCRVGDQDPLDPSDDRTGPLAGVAVLPEATLEMGPFNRLLIGTPLDGTLQWVDIFRRAHDRNGDLAEDWTPVAQQFEGREFLDRQVQPEWTYEYEIVPRVISEEVVSWIIDFEDLKRGARYGVGETFVASGVPITGQTFYFGAGAPDDSGYAEVDMQGLAGGSRQDMELGGINLDFRFADPLTSLRLLFGVYGGQQNIEINDERVIFDDFSKIHGTTIGGVGVSVQMVDRSLGRLMLAGPIESFAIGGQELWLDDVVGIEGGVALVGRVALTGQVTSQTDPYAPAGYVLINGGDPTTTSRIVDLTISADDTVGNTDGQIAPDRVPGTPVKDLQMRISNSPDFRGAAWERLRLEVTGWDLGPLVPGEASAVYVQFRDAPGNVSSTAMDTIMPPMAEVLDRYVFYNHSSFDGNNPLPNSSDRDAIALDKSALMPGETATFANYTSYSLGLNGVMIDVAGLPGTPTLADFVLRVGNDNQPGDWATAPKPTSITIEPGQGVNHSDRVKLIWQDYAVLKQWLQVVVLATANTGLAEADVFYFGNAVAEAGNSTTDAKVNPTDMLLARNNPRTFLNPAGVDFPYDYNRDARVNATDMLLARNNQTHFLNALKLITVPPAKDAFVEEAVAAQVENRAMALGEAEWQYELAQIGAKSSKDRKPHETLSDEVFVLWPGEIES
ncbi:MAG: VWA domain-containing protein [Pirellulales bacterium]|nr:VWA domain-containing protein [Pirellulales bacterium]